MKETLGIIAVLLAFIGQIPYLINIFKGKTKPHLYTWLIWSIVTAIAFLGQWQTGGGAGAWTTGVTGIITIGIFFLCFRYGTKDITLSDKVFLAGALIAIVPWLITKDPLLSVVLATIIDIVAYFPTIRKTYLDPTTETFSMFPINMARHALSIAALSIYSVTTYLYPAVLVLMNLVMILTIFLGRKKKIIDEGLPTQLE